MSRLVNGSAHRCDQRLARGHRRRVELVEFADAGRDLTSRRIRCHPSGQALQCLPGLDPHHGEPVGHLQRAAASYTVTISRGGSGAYAMKLSHFGRTLAVRRIR